MFSYVFITLICLAVLQFIFILLIFARIIGAILHHLSFESVFEINLLSGIFDILNTF